MEHKGDSPTVRNADRLAIAALGDKVYLFANTVLPQEALDVYEFNTGTLFVSLLATCCSRL